MTGSFCGSVVASRNLTRGGGSSSVFRSALNECVGKHVHFVDEVHLVPAPSRCVLHVVQELARVVDLGARRRVYFDQIDEASLIDLPAARAHSAGLGAHADFAVQALRENTRDGRLADAAGTGEQKRVMHAVAVERICERAAHVLLSDHFGEASWPPLARQSQITHRRSILTQCAGDGPHQPGLRHPTSPLPLLPSGPDGIHDWSSRSSRCGPP